MFMQIGACGRSSRCIQWHFTSALKFAFSYEVHFSDASLQIKADAFAEKIYLIKKSHLFNINLGLNF